MAMLSPPPLSPFPRLFSSLSPRLFPVALRFRRYTLSVFRTGSLPWCQRLRSSGPFESHPRRGGGLERLDQKGMRIGKEGARTRKGERETACYGRDGPFARRCSRRARSRARPGEREAFRAWNIHETWTSETRISPTRPRYPLLLTCALRNQIERVASKLILDILKTCVFSSFHDPANKFYTWHFPCINIIICK